MKIKNVTYPSALEKIPALPPDIIVKELTYNNIKEALESFCEDDGYWIKLYFLSGASEGIFLKDKLDKMIRNINNR